MSERCIGRLGRSVVRLRAGGGDGGSGGGMGRAR